MKIINLSSGFLYWYQSTTQCISVFSGQMEVTAINQPTNIPLDFIYFIKSDSKIKFQDCKIQTTQTEAKCEPGLITINSQMVFLLGISNQFKLISYIELNLIGLRLIP